MAGGKGWEDDMNFEFDMFLCFFGVVFFWGGGRWWFSLEMIQEKSLITIFFFLQNLDQRILASFWPAGRGCPPFFGTYAILRFVSLMFFFFFRFRGRDVRIPNKKTVYKRGGGFKHCLCSSRTLGNDQFDEHDLQRWSHHGWRLDASTLYTRICHSQVPVISVRLGSYVCMVILESLVTFFFDCRVLKFLLEVFHVLLPFFLVIWTPATLWCFKFHLKNKSAEKKRLVTMDDPFATH